MADEQQHNSEQADTGGTPHQSTSLGIYDRPRPEGITPVELTAIAASVLWLVIVAIYFLFIAPSGETAPESGAAAVLTAVFAVLMPIGMIWVAATVIRTSNIMRNESQRLQAAIDAIRHSYIAQQQGSNARSDASELVRKLDEIAAATRKTETALATFQTRRDERPRAAAPVPEQETADQPVLELGTTAEDITPPLPTDEFIRAMNFPETAEDQQGFAALRRALKDRNTSQLIQAAQDILTLLSQDGIYMDDLNPDPASTEIWRQFAQGARGRSIAALGGIHDRSSLALAGSRMKQDAIFRDTAHHFLRRFDQIFAEFEQNATDAEISALATTRTARAFMLLGRVAGTFD